MKKILFTALALSTSLFTGCGELESTAKGKDAKPTFMFWCFRKEVVSSDYYVPDMKTAQAGGYLQSHLKGIPGYVDSSYNLDTHTITVEYKSSSVRYMNFEEGIALAGFKANNRPAKPNVKVPEGVK